MCDISLTRMVKFLDWVQQWCRSRGWKCTLKSFHLVKIREISLKIWEKSLKTFAKSLKIWTNSMKIWAKMAPNVFWFENGAKITRRLVFLEVIPKTVVIRKYRPRSGPKVFRASLGKFGQKSFIPPKIACSYNLWSGVFQNFVEEWSYHYWRFPGRIFLSKISSKYCTRIPHSSWHEHDRGTPWGLWRQLANCFKKSCR